MQTMRLLILLSSLFIAGVVRASPASDNLTPDLEAVLNDEITKLIELYSDGFADSDQALRHITYGPLFDSDKPAAVVFFSLTGVGLSNVHHEYIAVFAQGGGLDLTRIKGPKEKAFHLVATALVGSKDTRTLIWDTAQITQGTIVVKGLRWGKGDPGCCPSESIEVEFTLPDNLVSELIPSRYPLLQEKIK